MSVAGDTISTWGRIMEITKGGIGGPGAHREGGLSGNRVGCCHPVVLGAGRAGRLREGRGAA